MTIAKRTLNIRRFTVLLCNVVFAACANPAHARSPDELRVLTAFEKFDDTALIGAAYHTRGLRFLRASYVDWSLGVLVRRGEARPFVAAGPAWRLGGSTPWFASFSISPTLIADPRLDGKTLGGNFHFTTAASFGRRIGSRWAISIRAQHISNGGLHDRNPGLDTIGVSIVNLTPR